jgi:phosphoribosylanthranilate isomerase
MVRVKICGITNIEDALAAARLGADALGFVFYPKSPRYIPPDRAAEIINAVPPFVTTVGVFVDPSPDELERVIERCRLDYVQLHGSESPQFCCEMSLSLGRRIIKAFRVKDETSLRRMRIYEVDAYLLDTYRSDLPGGTGLTFGWEVAYNLDVDRAHLILAGGLNPENVRDAVRLVRPWAVDVSSGVEIEPGRKDHDKIRRFIIAAKGGD